MWRVTYEIVTPESAAEGDAESRANWREALRIDNESKAGSNETF